MLPKDVLAEIFLYFTVEEISILFTVNTQFNIDVNWKKLIQMGFGINKRYCDTWKDTAKLLVQSNMINLSKKWINGKTYNDILFGSSKDSNYFSNLRIQYEVKEYYFPEHVRNSKIAIKFINNSDLTADSFRIFHGLDIYDEKYIEHHLSFYTREYIVLDHAHSQFLYTFNFIDPITYVICYSVIPYNKLRNMSSWEYFNLNVEILDKIRITYISTGHEVLCRNNEAAILMNQGKIQTYNNEDMYREKVKNDYGIHRMYEDSWRKTFLFFSGMKMINLNKIWVDGRTYSELLYSGDIESDEEVTREFIIISLAIIDMKSNLCKINYEATPKQQKILNKIKSVFVDPILIITNYTLLSSEDLSDLLEI